MNTQSIIALLAIILAPVSRGDGDEAFPWNALRGEKRYRNTVEQAFPNLEFGFYHATGDVIIGLLEDFDHDRVMLLCPPTDESVAKITRNGVEQKLMPGTEVTIKVSGQRHTIDGRIEDSPETAMDIHLGYWIDLDPADRLSITLTPRSPWKGKFQADYGPDSKWQTSCSVIDGGFTSKDPADVYEITRRSLLKQVVGILEQKNECLVRLESGVDQIVKRWQRSSGGNLEPMIVLIEDDIVIDTGKERQQVTADQLSGEMEFYRMVAAAAKRPFSIRIFVRKDGNDPLFRLLLQKLSEKSSVEAFVDFSNAPTPPVKRLSPPLPVPPRAHPKPEQDGGGQPAIRPESKQEGGDQPQPESERHSR